MPRSTLCLLVLLLTACGQSGDLYRPDQGPPKTKSKTHAQAGSPTAPVNEAQPGADESNPKKDTAAPVQP